MGVKARSYCLDEFTVTINSYNAYNEDPMCMRPYPIDANNYTSYTTKTGECLKMNNNMWAIMNVQPYDGREWQYDP